MALHAHDHLRHTIEGPFARESVAYCLIMPEHGLMGHWYTWVNERDEGGRAFVLHGTGPDPVFFDHKDGIAVGGQNFDHWDLDGAGLRVGEPLMGAKASFESTDLSVQFEFEGFHPAFDYDSNTTGTPSYLARNRYEQSGRISGRLTWNGTVYDFDGPGHRDQSWGTRDWDAIHHYKWIAASGNGVSANVMWTMAEGELDVNGYVFSGGVQSPIVDASARTKYGDDFVQDVVEFELTDEAGRTTSLDLDRRHTLARWDVSPTFNFTDTMFTGTLGGEYVQAYVEYTWPRSYLDHLLAR
ncbi:DUF7064 domain-containing protein [Rhodococcoides kyotonense]|uniref:Hydroxyneurosporene synthase (CrtC) n=1 Tax=Rhodococcoides kyotonense TaxID=398843 RepID=A0A239K210_9NOCA|nr:hypothetical protein [Rhodococcus kyotonensis]SNT12406.1 hypothetical protein SAMN05421642_109219 [Rhodococcus kyotonensis]